VVQNQIVIAVGVFTITYLAIVTEKLNRTAVAMTGAFMMIVLNVEVQEKAIEHVDFNTLGLLIGMMIIVNITKRSGVFEYIAIWAAKKSKGDPWKILVSFLVITSVASAFLDNVTTVLLIVPITLVITDALELNSLPFLIPEILMANIGGTATLIGDPPNIMIGSATDLGFMDFITALGPLVIFISILTIYAFKFIYKGEYTCKESNKKMIMKMNPNLAIKDVVLMKKSLIILALTIVGFVTHQYLGYESSTVALFFASILLLISKVDVEDIFIDIEWPTLFFFASLFILVGALVEVGIIDMLAQKMLNFTNGETVKTTMVILWVSAIASSFLDNIPFVATMIPMIKSMGLMSSISTEPLWWALSLGACLGGNGTIVGASANVIVSGISSKHGKPISFMSYMKIGFPIMIGSVFISSIYLYLFFT